MPVVLDAVAMREAGVNKVQLAQRLGIDEKEDRRLLDPHHGSKLPRIAEAVQALDTLLARWEYCFQATAAAFD